MGKRGRILVAVMAIMVAGGVGWSIFWMRSAPPEPVYHGKPLSYWMQGFDIPTSRTNRPNWADAEIALYDAGTNAIPTLLRMVQQDSSLKNTLLRWAYGIPYVKKHYPQRPTMGNFMVVQAFYVLHADAAPAVPALIKNLDGNSSSTAASISMLILGRMGSMATDAIPTLLRIASGNNQNMRAGALSALGQMQSDPDKVVPVLITALHDPSAVNRSVAAGALWYFGTNAKPAVPALVQIISEPDGGSNSVPTFPLPAGRNLSVRHGAESALQSIDPETYARVVTNTGSNPAP